MPLTFKQFLSAVLLRISAIQNLEPRTLLSLRDVRAELLLGNDALQIVTLFRQSAICSVFRTKLNALKTTADLLLYRVYCEFRARCSVVAGNADVGNGAWSIVDPHSA